MPALQGPQVPQRKLATTGPVSALSLSDSRLESAILKAAAVDYANQSPGTGRQQTAQPDRNTSNPSPIVASIMQASPQQQAPPSRRRVHSGRAAAMRAMPMQTYIGYTRYQTQFGGVLLFTFLFVILVFILTVSCLSCQLLC